MTLMTCGRRDGSRKGGDQRLRLWIGVALELGKLMCLFVLIDAVKCRI